MTISEQDVQASNQARNDIGKGTADLRQLDTSLRDIGRQLDRIEAKHQEWLKATKGRFNLFTVLWPAHFEVQLHTRYLLHLLNPQAARHSHHDCGALFLNLFIETLKKVSVQSRDGSNCSEALKPLDSFCWEKASVSSPNTDNGNLDIVIECDTSHAIAIENKIWANDQDKQISRYSSFMKKYEHNVLLYLTPYGHASTSADGANYYRISYRDHILPWLEACIQRTHEYANINQALQQYRDVVYQLIHGGHPMETQYMEQVEKLLRANPSIIEHWKTIEQAKEKLWEQCEQEFFRDLGIAIGQRHSDFLVIDDPQRPTACIGSFAVASPVETHKCHRVRVVTELVEDGDVYVYLSPDHHDSELPVQKDVFTRLYGAMESKVRYPKIEFNTDRWPAGRWWVADMGDSVNKCLRGDNDRKKCVADIAEKVGEYITLAKEGWREVSSDAATPIPSPE